MKDRNPSQRNIHAGVDKYREFQYFDPRELGEFPGLKIPQFCAFAGPSLWVSYRSNKWTGKNENYIHEHDPGVRTYRPDLRANQVAVPKHIRNTLVIVKLGLCLGFAYEDPDGEEISAEVSRPYPELYCTPNGKALLVLAGTRLCALIWGSKLSITARGIVG